MTKRANDPTSASAEICTLARKMPAQAKIIQDYDATALIGLRTRARHAAVMCGEDDDAIELPKLDQLMATVAIVRCLMPQRLRGGEVKAMRKIMGMTLSELAQKLDEKTAVETVSRWESDTQPIGGYAEKVLRLLICEELRTKAPGVSYDGSMISHLKQVDPWRSNPDYELPIIEVELMKVKQDTCVDDTWTLDAA